MTRMTLDTMTEPWDCYSNTTTAVCGNIQVSGHLHFEHLRCGEHREKDEEYEYEHGEDEDDDSDIHEYNPKAEEDTKQEEVVPEFDYNATEFDAEGGDAVQADLREVDEEEDETQDHDAVQADRLEVEDEADVGHEGAEDLGEEDAEAREDLEGEEDDDEEVCEDENEEYDEEGLDEDEEHDDDYDDNDCDYDNNCDDYDSLGGSGRVRGDSSDHRVHP